MGVSSLGVGSSILTQDVIDQLRAADEAKFVKPVETRISDNKAKTTAFDQMNALMDSAYESLKSLTEYGVFEGRNTSVDDEDVLSITASESSDIQDFTIEVQTLATKEVEQSGGFTSRTDSIATGDGTMELSVGDKKFPIDYTSETSLEDLKELIDEEAGDSVSTTIVQVADGDFRLIFSAMDTGVGQEISITDLSIDNDDKASGGRSDKGSGGNALGNLSAAFTSEMTNIQEAVDAEFKFNGLDITRSSNSVDNLLSGVKITLKEIGTTEVSVKQDRDKIEEKITNFVDKYNSAVFQLSEDTKSSEKLEDRGVFSNDNTIKSMNTTIKNIISTVGGSAGKLEDFGIELDKDGRLSLDTEVLNEKLDNDPDSVHAFFIGGTFTKEDSYTTDENGLTTMSQKGFTIEVTGAFTELENSFAKYSKGSTILDKYEESLETRLESLDKQKESAVERLNNSYAIMQKRFAAYDAIISRFNTASNMFTQMINTEAANN